MEVLTYDCIQVIFPFQYRQGLTDEMETSRILLFLLFFISSSFDVRYKP